MKWECFNTAAAAAKSLQSCPTLCSPTDGYVNGRRSNYPYGEVRTDWLGYPVLLGDRESSDHTAKSLQSCPTLCDPRDGSPPGSPVCGILQARTLEWVAISFSNA